MMKKVKGLGAMLLAGLLVIPGNLGLAGQVLAQGDTKTEDKQLQELRQKRQEQWEEREREAKQLKKYRPAPKSRRAAPAATR